VGERRINDELISPFSLSSESEEEEGRESGNLIWWQVREEGS